MKVMIIGYSGSGKSTLAKLIAEKYNLPLLYLDKVQFIENWETRDKQEALKIVKNFLDKNQDGWVIDGNYSKRYFEQRALEANQIIFMNFNRFNCFYRAFKRSKIYKGKARESITQGCEEKFDFEFMKWILFSGRSKTIKQNFNNIKKNYKEKLIEIKNQRQLDQYIRNNLQ